VPGLPDLIISAINLDRDMVPYGGTVHAQVVVLNQGNASAGAFRVTWDFGSGNGGHDVPCCLAPNQSYAMEWTSLPLSTSYNTLATADENQTVQESNEANNRRWQWLNVELPTIDLDLVAIGGISDRARWGQQAYADIVVKNNGNGPSGPFFARCVFCPDVCEWNVDSLGPSEERELSVCSIVLYPPCDWRCYIDPANTVQESNEDNNSQGTRLDLIP
jgi:hypothetical protein